MGLAWWDGLVRVSIFLVVLGLTGCGAADVGNARDGGPAHPDAGFSNLDGQDSRDDGAASAFDNPTILLGAGRWWLHDVASGHQYVIHWTDSDQSFWTSTNRFSIEPQRDLGGTWTMRSSDVPTFCALVRATGDPDTVELWSCGDAANPRALFGLLRRGPWLIHEIPLPLLDTTSTPPVSAVYGFDATGQRVVFSVGNELWLWK